MSRKGGYKIIDLSKIESANHIYNQLKNTKDKVVLVSGVTIDNVKYEDTWCELSFDEEYAYLKSNSFTIEVIVDEISFYKGYQLKLVATGTYNNEKSNRISKQYDLDNALETYKTYYVEYYNDDAVNYVTAIINTRNANASNISTQASFIGYNVNTDQPTPCFMYYYDEIEEYNPNITISSMIEDVEIYGGDNDYIRVYELPFSI